MEIRTGDRVMVSHNSHTMHSGLRGKQGRVVRVFEDNETCLVDLKWVAPEGSGWVSQGSLSSFFFRELELVSGKVEIELSAEDGISIYVDATKDQMDFLMRIVDEFTDLQLSNDRYTYAPSITVTRVDDADEQ